MPFKRTTVYADTADLALIKEAAVRRGVAEAELIREGIHLAALANREWDEPFFEETYQLGGPVTRDDIRDAVTNGLIDDDPDHA